MIEDLERKLDIELRMRSGAENLLNSSKKKDKVCGFSRQVTRESVDTCSSFLFS